MGDARACKPEHERLTGFKGQACLVEAKCKVENTIFTVRSMVSNQHSVPVRFRDISTEKLATL